MRLRSCLGELHFKNLNFVLTSFTQTVAPQALSFKKLKLETNFMKFIRLLRGCFKNTVFISPHEVIRKLPTMSLVTQHTTFVLSRDTPLIIKVIKKTRINQLYYKNWSSYASQTLLEPTLTICWSYFIVRLKNQI
jgi:hypothetical protein